MRIIERDSAGRALLSLSRSLSKGGRAAQEQIAGPRPEQLPFLFCATLELSADLRPRGAS